MQKTIITCDVCGGERDVRLGDKPYVSKRIALIEGAMNVEDLDICDDCFRDVKKTSLARVLQDERARHL